MVRGRDGDVARRAAARAYASRDSSPPSATSRSPSARGARLERLAHVVVRLPRHRDLEREPLGRQRARRRRRTPPGPCRGPSGAATPRAARSPAHERRGVERRRGRTAAAARRERSRDRAARRARAVVGEPAEERAGSRRGSCRGCTRELKTHTSAASADRDVDERVREVPVAAVAVRVRELVLVEVDGRRARPASASRASAEELGQVDEGRGEHARPTARRAACSARTSSASVIAEPRHPPLPLARGQREQVVRPSRSRAEQPVEERRGASRRSTARRRAAGRLTPPPLPAAPRRAFGGRYAGQRKSTCVARLERRRAPCASTSSARLGRVELLRCSRAWRACAA